MLVGNFAVDCISGTVLMRVEVVALDGSRVQSIVFVIVSVFAVISVIAVVGVVICLVVVGSSIRKTSATSSAASAVDCIGGCCLWEVKSMSGGYTVIGFSVLLLFLVVTAFGIVVVIVGSIIKRSSSSLSATLAVDCISGCGSWEVEAMAKGSHRSIFAVVSVVVVVGCVVGIGVVVGIIVRPVVASRIKLARMLAFSASKSMRCGGGVMGR